MSVGQINSCNLNVCPCPQDLVRLDRKSSHATDKIAALEKEEDQLTKLLDEEEEAMDVLQELLAAVDDVENRCCLDAPAANESLESVEKKLKEGLATLSSVKKKHEVEFRYFRLHHLAVPALFPLFKKYLQVSESLMMKQVMLVWKQSVRYNLTTAEIT